MTNKLKRNGRFFWHGRMLAWLVASVLLSGCSGTLKEQHLLATVDKKTGETVNIFKISVTGNVGLANARYMAGFYDERAVDLFFNESKSTTLDSANLSTADIPPIFKTVACEDVTSQKCKDDQEAQLKLVPVGRGSAAEDGIFVLILSTNADAIAGTIGAFAENQTLMQSVMYLATRGDLEAKAKIDATRATLTVQRSAMIDEIGKLLDQAANQKAESDLKGVYLAVLQAAASGLAPNVAPSFKTLDEAATWFAAVPRGSKQ